MVSPLPSTPLHHGGNLHGAIQVYGGSRQQWLDLSTGINPVGYPLRMPPLQSWQRLPEQDATLEIQAANYYGCPEILAVAGSQAAIQALPRLRPHSRVGVITPGYREHYRAWTDQGHRVVEIGDDQIATSIDRLDVLVVINPNNPSGRHYHPEQLLEWHRRLQRGNGWLLVDEAFIDTTPELSLAAYATRPGLIILRSLGKFFGLAGIRCGFVLAEAALREALARLLGPWALPGPSRHAAIQALQDRDWQQQMRLTLPAAGQRLGQLLENELGIESRGTALFQTVATPHSQQWFEALAEQQILVRHFEEIQRLRFGLPGTEQEWLRLQQALRGVSSLGKSFGY